jgi:hypothetical protein
VFLFLCSFVRSFAPDYYFFVFAHRVSFFFFFLSGKTHHNELFEMKNELFEMKNELFEMKNELFEMKNENNKWFVHEKSPSDLLLYPFHSSVLSERNILSRSWA